MLTMPFWSVVPCLLWELQRREPTVLLFHVRDRFYKYELCHGFFRAHTQFKSVHMHVLLLRLQSPLTSCPPPDYCNALYAVFTNMFTTGRGCCSWFFNWDKNRKHISPILAPLHWLLVQCRVDFKMLVFVFKAFPVLWISLLREGSVSVSRLTATSSCMDPDCIHLLTWWIWMRMS